MITWPQEYGGRGANLIEWLIFEEEYYRAGAPLRVNQNGIFLLGPTLMEFGTPEQKARFLPKMASGEEIWAQGWSEPQAGSDLAAHPRDGARATATTTCCAVTRSGRRARRLRTGASASSAPIRRPSDIAVSRSSCCRSSTTAYACAASAQIHGEPGFAEIFFEDARVPVANRLGAEGQGWHIAMATAGFERGLMLRSPARFQAAAQRLRRAVSAPCARSRPGGRGRGRAGLDGRRELCAQHVHDGDPSHGGWLDRRRGEPQQDLLVGARPATCIAPR